MYPHADAPSTTPGADTTVAATIVARRTSAMAPPMQIDYTGDCRSGPGPTGMIAYLVGELGQVGFAPLALVVGHRVEPVERLVAHLAVVAGTAVLAQRPRE